MPVAERRLPIREEAVRCDQVQRVLGPRHGDIEQPTLLLDLSRRAGAEVRRHAAIDDVEHEDRFPFLALGRMDGGEDQVILIEQRHTRLIARGIRRIEGEVGQKARPRRVARRDLLELQQVGLTNG